MMMKTEWGERGPKKIVPTHTRLERQKEALHNMTFGIKLPKVECYCGIKVRVNIFELYDGYCTCPRCERKIKVNQIPQHKRIMDKLQKMFAKLQGGDEQ